MSKPVYRLEAGLVRELAVCAAHAHNGDEIGLALRQKVIARVIRWLTPAQRESLYLYYGRGLSMEDIARMMEVRTSTVSRNVQNGVRHIRAALELIE